MNNKPLKFSIQLSAALVTLGMFASCEKTEFTEADALALENSRARIMDSLEAVKAERDLENMKDYRDFLRVQDSLIKMNAGGKVVYSVIVVPGGGSAFSGGRADQVQGLKGALVTVMQYGKTIKAETDNAGYASFPELRSGEATVHVGSPSGDDLEGYTDMSYVVNLTPDGGVANDGVRMVGNVVPVFENGATSDQVDKMSMISGIAFAELDLTNNVEELAPEGTSFTASIDVNSDAFLNRYIREPNSIDEGTDGMGGSTTKSGYIQRVAYQDASTTARTDGDGKYTMMVSATASGLPMKINYSDFAADRTYFQLDFDYLGGDDGYFDDGDLGPVNKRFIYGPNVAWNTGGVDGRGGFATGAFRTFGFGSWDFVQEDAVIEANLASSGNVLVAPVTEGTFGTENCLVLHPTVFAFNGVGVNIPQRNMAACDPITTVTGFTAGQRAGEYVADHSRASGLTAADLAANAVTPPTVTFSASPTGVAADNAAGFAVLSNSGTSVNTDLGIGPVTSYGASPTFTPAPSAAPAAAPTIAGSALRRLHKIVVTNAGKGYTTAPTVTITRPAVGIAGRGTIQAPSNRLTAVRVIDGGFAFLPQANNPAAATAADYTFLARQWVAAYNNGFPIAGTANQRAGLAEPTGGGFGFDAVGRGTRVDPFLNVPAGPTGSVDVDFEYDWENTFTGEAASAIGVVQSIRIISGGDAWTTATLGLLNANPFKYFSTEAAIPSEDTSGDDLFIVSSGGLFFNTNTAAAGGYGGVVAGTPALGAVSGASSTLMLITTGATGFSSGVGGSPAFSIGNGYVFSPLIRVNAGNASLSTRCNANGQLTELRIEDSGNNYASIAPASVRVEIVPPTNTLSAVFYTGGASIDNYSIDKATDISKQGEGKFVARKNATPSVAGVRADQNTYWARFDAPTGGGTAAVGVPIFADQMPTGSGAPSTLTTAASSTRRMVGLEIVDAGIGYEPAQVIRFSVEVQANNTGASVAADAAVTSNLGFATVSFTIVNGGLGYACRPEIFVSGGGILLDDPNLPEVDDFTFDFNTEGTIVGITFVPSNPVPYTVAGVAADPLVVTTSVARLESAFNRVTFDDGVNFNRNGATMLIQGNGDAIVGVDGAIFGSTAFVATGAVDFAGYAAYTGPAAVAIGQVSTGSTTWGRFFRAAAGLAQGQYGATIDGEQAGDPVGQYIVAPTLSVTGGTGAEIVAVLNNSGLFYNASQPGGIMDMAVANGGSGYGFLFTNDISMTPEPFRVLGGPDGTTRTRFLPGTANLDTDTNGDGTNDINRFPDAVEAFETVSGLQYVRDIHYGTGQELE